MKFKFNLLANICLVASVTTGAHAWGAAGQLEFVPLEP